MSEAISRLTDNGPYQVLVETGHHAFVMDEPVAVGGFDTGPSPFDLLCSALASCTLMTVRLYAVRKGWILDQLSVRVAHRKEAGGKDRFETTLELGDVTEEQRERLLYIAQRCPVHLLLEQGADVPTVVASEAGATLAV